MKQYKVSSTGFRGVQETRSGRYAAMIRINGKNTSLGTFDTDKQAARAYDQAVLKYNHSTTKLNFPQPTTNEIQIKVSESPGNNINMLTGGLEAIEADGEVEVEVEDMLESNDPLLLSHVSLTKDHSVSFHPSTKFYGCYWRDGKKTLRGFPTASGVDYVTWVKNIRHSSSTSPSPTTTAAPPNKKKSKSNNEATSNNTATNQKNSSVCVFVTIPKASRYANVVLAASLQAIRELPVTDVSLMGKTMSKEQVVREIDEHVVFAEVNIDFMDNAGTDSSCQIVEAVLQPRKPKKWTMPMHMGNLRAQTKLDMIHKPINTVSSFRKDKELSKYLVVLRVLVLATTEAPSLLSPQEHQYTVVAACRSPGFVIGSTRSLRQKRATTPNVEEQQNSSLKIAKISSSSSSSPPSPSPPFSSSSSSYSSSSSSSSSDDNISTPGSNSPLPKHQLFSQSSMLEKISAVSDGIEQIEEEFSALPVESLIDLPATQHRKRSHEMMRHYSAAPAK